MVLFAFAVARYLAQLACISCTHTESFPVFLREWIISPTSHLVKIGVNINEAVTINRPWRYEWHYL